MQEFSINGFKYGLDTRRDALTSQPGTLLTCENGSINPGTEIEKRKAFVLFGDLNIHDTDGHPGLFGIEVTKDGIITFSHAVDVNSSPYVTLGPKLVSALPAGFTLKTLIHPSVEFETDYDDTLHRLTQIVFSSDYNGLFFVAAKFADGNTFLYYEGDSRNAAGAIFFRAVLQSHSGLILDTTTPATELAAEIADIGWSIVENKDENGVTQNGSYILISPPSDYFTPIATYKSTNAFIGVKNIDQDGVAAPGAKAVSGFKITVDSGTYALAAPASAAAPTPTVPLFDGTVASTGVIATTTAAIARSVNDYSSVHGYSALATADSVFIYAPASFGNMTFDLSVTTTTATIQAAGTPPTALSGVIKPSPLEVDQFLTRNKPTKVKGDVKIDASGGSGAYTFLWAAVAGDASGIAITQKSGTTNVANAMASFSKTLDPNTTVKGNFQCTISDGAHPDKIVFLTVSLTATFVSGK